MPTILTKKSDTPGAVPATANLTNAAGGAELAVNTADKRLFSINSSSAIIEVGTNPSSLTCADASFTVARISSGTVTQLTSTSATITTLTSTSASVTNLTATSIVISNLSIASANITTLTSTNATAASLTVSTGNLTFSSTGQRITGDMSNATAASRLFLQSSTTNGNTNVGIIPNGTGTISLLQVYSASDPANSSFLDLRCDSAADSRIRSGITGTGTYLPMTFYTGGSERIRLDTSGNLGIGTTSPSTNLDVGGGSGAVSVRINGGASGIGNGANIYLSNNGSVVGTLGNPSVAYGGAFDNSIALTGYYGLRFDTNGSERMRLDTSGNLLVGTATGLAGSRFTVVGGGTQLSGGTTAQEGVRIQRATGYATFTGINNDNNAYNGLQFFTGASAAATIDTSGNVGIGGTADAYAKTQIKGNLPTSGGTSVSYDTQAVITSAATSNAIMYESFPSVQNASFTLPSLYHFLAAQGTKGASATITSQAGFFVDSSLTGATNNYGFYSNIASGSNRWNFYANGTAANYFAGVVGIGGAAGGAVGDEKLRVIGTDTDSWVITWEDSAGGRLGGLYANATVVGVGSVSNVPLIFQTNQVERMRITTAGNIVAGASAALATTATDGFLYVPTCAGTPTGTPTAITGMAPIVVDTTNNKLYFYSTGVWRDAGP